MTGKTHKAIGIATGVAFTLYSVGSGNPLYAIGMLSAPLGAMLPDIDHNHSKLGSKRKKMTELMKKFIIITMITVLLALIIVGYLSKTLLYIMLFVLLPVTILALMSKNPKLKYKLKFFTKHRGIMHTLVIPVSFLVGSFFIDIEVVKVVLIGLAAGYLSHLIADCTTRTGCPVLWPFSRKCVKVIKITTGTVWEYVTGIILSGGIIWIGIWLGRH